VHYIVPCWPQPFNTQAVDFQPRTKNVSAQHSIPPCVSTKYVDKSLFFWAVSQSCRIPHAQGSEFELSGTCRSMGRNYIFCKSMCFKDCFVFLKGFHSANRLYFEPRRLPQRWIGLNLASSHWTWQSFIFSINQPLQTFKCTRNDGSTFWYFERQSNVKSPSRTIR
jgi:hypothetical protein